MGKQKKIAEVLSRARHADTSLKTSALVDRLGDAADVIVRLQHERDEAAVRWKSLLSELWEGVRAHGLLAPKGGRDGERLIHAYCGTVVSLQNDVERLTSERSQWQVAAEEAGRTVQSLQAQISRLKREHGGALAVLRQEQRTRTEGLETVIALRAEVSRVIIERDEARAAAWPQGGHWTREPVKVEGWYVCGWRDEDGHICVPELRSVGPRLPLRFLEQRWSVPVLVDALPIMPPVPEEL